MNEANEHKDRKSELKWMPCKGEQQDIDKTLEMRRGLGPVELNGSPELGKRVAEDPERHNEQRNDTAGGMGGILAATLPYDLHDSFHAVRCQECAHEENARRLREGNANASHGEDQKRGHALERDVPRPMPLTKQAETDGTGA